MRIRIRKPFKDWVLYWKSIKVKYESLRNEADISKVKQSVSCLVWRVVEIDVMVQGRNRILHYKRLTSSTFL